MSLPTPYYDRDGITIYCGDCRHMLDDIEARGAVVTDPPYGIGLQNNDTSGHRSDRSFEIAGDEDGVAAFSALCWAEEHRLPTIAFASPWKPWLGPSRNLIVWDKGGAVGGGGDIKTCLKRSWELIQVFRNGPINGPRGESVWRYPMVPADTQLHICAKPVALMQRLIQTFTASTDCIIDPFVGSGSTLVAAKLEGRRAVGIEINERYCQIAVNRLRQNVLEWEGAAL